MLLLALIGVWLAATILVLALARAASRGDQLTVEYFERRRTPAVTPLWTSPRAAVPHRGAIVTPIAPLRRAR
jgi:hypothetical protein